METTTLAWAAGLFEGEGCIRINKATKRNLGHLVVSVTNTDFQVIDFFQARWPGYMKSAAGLRPDQRPAWVWVYAARKAAAFLAAIRPFIVRDIVKERIDCALRFQAGKSKPGATRVTDEYRAEQFAAYLWMKELNVRGVTARPYPHCPQAGDWRRQ